MFFFSLLKCEFFTFDCVLFLTTILVVTRTRSNFGPKRPKPLAKLNIEAFLIHQTIITDT